MILNLTIMIIVGALIGWFTNYIAIKLLFRPYNEINLLGFKIQGVIPKRREKLTETIADTINQELLSLQDITKKIENINIEDDIDEIVSKIVDEKLRKELLEKFPMAAMFLNESIINKIKFFVKNAILENKDKIIEKVIYKLENQIDLKEIIIEKMEKFSLEEIENIILKVSKIELKHIEIIGGVIGGLIGFVQFILVNALK